MKFYLPMLFALLLMSASASAMETLEELTAAVRKACEDHDGEALWALYHLKGQPEELTAAYKPFATSIAKHKHMQVQEIKVVAYDEHKSELPGKFKERELEFLVKPTHWVKIRMATPEGVKPKDPLLFNKATMNCLAAKVEGKWQLIGVKFKE